MKARHWTALAFLILLEGLLLTLLGNDSGLLAVTLLSVVTAVAGLWLMRGEDFSLWTLVEVELQQHRLPTDELWQALLLWLAGGLLLIPGILTDAMGLALTVPEVRRALIEQLTLYLRRRWSALHRNS